MRKNVKEMKKNRQKSFILWAFVVVILGSCLIACEKYERDVFSELKVVEFGNFAVLAWDMDGFDNEYGVCLSTSQNPTINNAEKVVDGHYNDIFYSSDEEYGYREYYYLSQYGMEGRYYAEVEGLTSQTTYYARAYIKYKETTMYSEQIEFKTSEEPELSLPVLSTLAATSIAASSATLGGNITFVGYPAYTEKGICYSTSQNPTTSNHFVTVSGSGTGNYTTTVSGLSSNTTYYARAYAKNSQGTAYGEQVSFKTQTPTTAQVRIRTDRGYSNISWIGFYDGVTNAIIATYNIEQGAHTSDYFHIPAGNYKLVYYDSNEDKWYYNPNNPSIENYNFQISRKYTVAFLDHNVSPWVYFTVTYDGTF